MAFTAWRLFIPFFLTYHINVMALDPTARLVDESGLFSYECGAILSTSVQASSFCQGNDEDRGHVNGFVTILTIILSLIRRLSVVARQQNGATLKKLELYQLNAAASAADHNCNGGGVIVEEREENVAAAEDEGRSTPSSPTEAETAVMAPPASAPEAAGIAASWSEEDGRVASKRRAADDSVSNGNCHNGVRNGIGIRYGKIFKLSNYYI